MRLEIVLNELKAADEIMRSGNLGSSPYSSLQLVAKSFLHDGLTAGNTRQRLEEFFVACDSSANLVTWSNKLDDIVTSAQKNPAVVIDYIGVSAPEMERISILSSSPAQRLAFTELCLAKYEHTRNPKNDYWVCLKDTNIMKMANINTSKKGQCNLLRMLSDNGLVERAKKVDSLSVHVLFADDYKPVLKVTDFRNLGWQYLRYKGGPFAVCENCGIVFKRNNTVGRPPKYCPECAIRIRMENNVNSVMKYRAAKTAKK